MSLLQLHRALHRPPPLRCHHGDGGIYVVNRHTNWIERFSLLVLIIFALWLTVASIFA